MVTVLGSESRRLGSSPSSFYFHNDFLRPAVLMGAGEFTGGGSLLLTSISIQGEWKY